MPLRLCMYVTMISWERVCAAVIQIMYPFLIEWGWERASLRAHSPLSHRSVFKTSSFGGVGMEVQFEKGLKNFDVGRKEKVLKMRRSHRVKR